MLEANPEKGQRALKRIVVGSCEAVPRIRGLAVGFGHTVTYLMRTRECAPKAMDCSRVEAHAGHGGDPCLTASTVAAEPRGECAPQSDAARCEQDCHSGPPQRKRILIRPQAGRSEARFEGGASLMGPLQGAAAFAVYVDSNSGAGFRSSGIVVER